MNQFYTEAQRRLQGEFETTALAEGMAATIVTDEVSAEQEQFISARDNFFLATVDEYGFPSVSYKGGAVGFVRTINSRTICFPNYDGNGMFMSMGNIVDAGKVGLLFVDFEKPHRIRLRGSATLIKDGPLLESYPGALAVTQITIDSIWQNCPRYVHRMQKVDASPYVPKADGTAPLALWKRIDGIQALLNEADRAQAQSVGLITGEDYAEKIEKGELS